MIDWDRRRQSENEFFERVLVEVGARTVLDIACGTGYHTVTLNLSGFDVIASDGSANMLAKARENVREHGPNLRFVESEWSALSQYFPRGAQFDAIVCLGNAFTHLFEEADRIASLKEIYSLLNHGGVAIIDQRNYDSILDEGYSSKHQYYYLGSSVEVSPSSIRDDEVELEYNYSDDETHSLTLYPIRQAHLTQLLRDAGFASVVRYGDFKRDYRFLDPDFVIQVARKTQSEVSRAPRLSVPTTVVGSEGAEDDAFWEVKKIFSESVEEVFADGMESTLSRSLHSMIRMNGHGAIGAIDRLLRSGQVNAEVAGEALRQVGIVDDPISHQRRLGLLLDYLESSDPRLRHAAAIGIAALDDPIAVASIRQALGRENSPTLKRNLQLVLDQLEALERWPSS